MFAGQEKVLIIGCGPGGRDYLLPAAVRAAAQVEVLGGARRLFNLFPEFSGSKVFFTQNDARTFCAELAACTGSKGVLVSGDPGLYSLAGAVLDYFGAENCRIIPGISSVDVALARLNLLRAETLVLSAHAPQCPELAQFLLSLQVPEIKGFISERWRNIALLAGNPENNSLIMQLAQLLAGAALPEAAGQGALNWRINVLRDLTLDTEEVIACQINELPALLARGRVIVVFSF